MKSENSYNQKHFSPIIVSLYAILIASFAFVSILSRGMVFKSMFESKTGYYLRDFAESIINGANTKLYYDSGLVYSPLTKLFFMLLLYAFPFLDLESGYAMQQLLSCPHFYIIYYAIFAFSLFLIIASIWIKFKNYKCVTRLALIGLIATSYPMIYSLCTGDIIILSFALLIAFLCLYKSNNKLLHELSIVSFALATSGKIYLFLFIVILIKDKSYKDVIKYLAMVLLLFALPGAFLIKGDDFLTFIKSINGDYYPALPNGNYNAQLWLMRIGLVATSSFVYVGTNYFFLATFMTLAVIIKEKYQVYLLIGLSILCICGTQGLYCSLYLIPSLLSLTLKEKRKIIDNIVLISLFFLIIINCCFVDKHFVYDYSLVTLLLLPIIYLFTFINCARYLHLKYFNKNINEKESNNQNKTESDKKQKIIINEKLVYATLIAIGITIYNFVWINKIFTMASDWPDLYVGLIDKGKKPYVDFYYYLPPFNLLWDYVLIKISFGSELVFRIWRLVERIIITEIMFFIISKKVKPSIAALGCFVGAVLSTANILFVAGDYNSFIALELVLLSLCVYKYLGLANEKLIKKYIYSMLIGLMGGLMFLTKQTIFLSCFIVFGLFFICIITTKKDTTPFKTFGCVLIGALIPLAITAIYLLSINGFEAFIYQCYIDTSSKGTLSDILISRLAKVFSTHFTIIVGIVIFFIAIISKNKVDKTGNTITALLVTISLLLIIYHIGLFASYILMITDTTWVLMFVSLALFVIFEFVPYLKKVSFIITTAGIFLFVFLSGKETASSIVISTNFFTLNELFLTFLLFFLVIWIVYHISVHFKDKNYDLTAILLIITIFCNSYSCIMTSGATTTVGSLDAMLSIPTLCYVAFNDKTTPKKVFVPFIEMACCIASILAITTKALTPYAWWGINESSIWDKTETSDINKLRGFKFSKEEKNKFDEINKVIDYYTDDQSIIWSFPYGCVYNIFESNYNLVGFVPVNFYDVCADDYAIEEASYLNERNPDIVVWIDIPGCMETHETIFRGGEPLGQRKIQKWFSSVKKSNYTLIGQSGNVFVYKINDETPVTITYIEDPNAVNQTA